MPKGSCRWKIIYILQVNNYKKLIITIKSTLYEFIIFFMLHLKVKLYIGTIYDSICSSYKHVWWNNTEKSHVRMNKN